ncbi:YgiT-type zinc finger protein [Lentibacillus lipolyticus]|nr:YgiT-type zinc finger protein [Lentibacillus lipolyticus]
MSTVEERTHTMMDVPCKCGGYAKHRIGDVEHVIGSKKMIIKNVPHYYCEFCGTTSYGTGVNVSKLLKEAYSKNLSEIFYH